MKKKNVDFWYLKIVTFFFLIFQHHEKCSTYFILFTGVSLWLNETFYSQKNGLNVFLENMWSKKKHYIWLITENVLFALIWNVLGKRVKRTLIVIIVKKIRKGSNLEKKAPRKHLKIITQKTFGDDYIFTICLNWRNWPELLVFIHFWLFFKKLK